MRLVDRAVNSEVYTVGSTGRSKLQVKMVALRARHFSISHTNSLAEARLARRDRVSIPRF